MRHILDEQSPLMPSVLAEQLSLFAVPDGDASLEKLCAEAVEAFPEEARSVRSGKINVVNVILGRVMKASRGTVDAKAARTTLLRMLKP